MLLRERRVFAEGPARASRRAEGSFVAIAWNLSEVAQAGWSSRLKTSNQVRRCVRPLLIGSVDRPFPAWRAMGSPKLPTFRQIARLRVASDLPAAQILKLDANRQPRFDMRPEGLVLIEAA